jgi:hypothetical protein
MVPSKAYFLTTQASHLHLLCGVLSFVFCLSPVECKLSESTSCPSLSVVPLAPMTMCGTQEVLSRFSLKHK